MSGKKPDEVVAPPKVAPPKAPAMPETGRQVVGQNQRKVDGVKLVTGRATFVDDIVLPEMLHARILRSPHAHARIRAIDTRAAEALPGVHAVICHENVPRVAYTTAGQGHPEPSPYDNFMFDRKVRFVGDRVAAVAAETPEIAEKALELIAVDYEILPPLFDPEAAMAEGAPQIHDEPDARGIYDARRNIAAHVEMEIGDVARGFAESDLVVENVYRVPYVQQCPLEPHITITWLDEDDRLVVRTTTQVPFHIRRILAPLLEIPVQRIRVVKPRVGGGFGAKQEVLIEDIPAMLTLRTGRPVRLELTRKEEFQSSRTRHPQIIRMRTGLTKEGRIVAQEMRIVANTGAYGTHALTVQCNSGSKTLPLYRCENVRFSADAVYTNLPVAGAFRGYGGPQGFFALESQMDACAAALGLDPVEFRRRNVIRAGEGSPIFRALGEGKEGFDQTIQSYGLDTCIEKGMASIGWREKRGKPGSGKKRRGVGCAFAMHGTGIPGVDMGAAAIKMNEDASFNLMVGATDIGTGSDTVFAQIAAEVLDVAAEKIQVYSSDTDFTPFDVGAYASSTTYISGQAVKKASEAVKAQIVKVAARLLEAPADRLRCRGGKVFDPAGRSVTYEEIALHSLYVDAQFQIMGIASHMSYDSPPPFATQFAEVEVDCETGEIKVEKLVACVDCGVAVNPKMAEGQIEGGLMQSLGYALSEAFHFDGKGNLLETSFRDYAIFTALDMPLIETHLVETYEPTGPFGAKSVAEIPMDGTAPAIANAVFDATGVRITEIPITPERMRAALRGDGKNGKW